jgi:hypothetical protein
MPEMIVLVVDDAEKVEEILNTWVALGIPGVTLLDGAGLGHALTPRGAREDLPLIPSLASMLRQREEHSRVLFSVVPDGFEVEALIVATEAITGPLDDPDTGILFTVPVTRVRGLGRRH